SPYLRFGQVSAHQAWHIAGQNRQADDKQLDIFRSELGWREFSYSLLHFNPAMKTQPLQPRFAGFGWAENEDHLRAWQIGQTGYPIVDAAMRELYQTGYMHNRVRMIVGSFLVKNLLLHWHHGEAWFWDCLFDADRANNSAGWQWIAGCGADAAPYFRVFNPVTQGQKFDADGDYTRKYVPELRDMPNKYLFNPWDAPADILARARVRLGSDYPKPIVEVKASRQRALDTFAQMPKLNPDEANISEMGR
ncbi:MAG: cryptochrome/photolyase family protein, partial [Candidatus Puniceispirillaceae bacterium]